MYGKLFASTFTGSLCGSGPTVFAVWSYVIANTYESSIELNPRLLAGIIGADVESVRKAIDFLCQPDPESRNPDHDGCRLIRDGQFQYRVVSHAIYRAMRDDEALRAYNREKQRESRQRRGLSTLTVNDCQATSIQTDTYTEADTEVRTVEAVPVRTVRETSVSTAPNENHGGGHDRRFAERRNGDGANEPGSLPRDHAKHTICGGPTSKFCLTYNQYDTLAKKYHGETPGETREAINSFYEHVKALIPEGKLPGDMVWLLQHFDAWLIQIGRIAPAPTKAKKQRRELTPEDLARIDREVKAEQAHKRNGARR